MKTVRQITGALLVLAVLFALPAVARDGDFVPSFGVAGREQVGFSPSLSISASSFAFNASVIQPADGKILVIGDVINGASRDFGVLRLNPNGTLDTNFGGGAGGQVLVPFDLGGSNNDDPGSLLLDAQGNILIAGTADGASSGGGSDFAVTRLTPNGALDTTFSGDGKATVAFDLGPAGQRNDACIRAVLQGDGKIVLVGKAQTGVSSGNASLQTTRMAIARLTTSGTRDTAFNGSGLVTIDFGPASPISVAVGVAVQTDGGIVVVGAAANSGSDPSMAMARLTATGQLDTHFGNGGILQFTPAINGYAISELIDVVSLPDNSFVVAGAIAPAASSNYDFVFARFSVTGALDTSFGNNGYTVVPFDLGGVLADAPIALRRDGEGRFVAIGDANTADNSAAALVRLTPDGMLDNTFGTLGTLAVSSAAPGTTMYGDVGSGLAIAPDGSLIATSYAVVDAAGHTRVGVAKLVGDTIFSGRFDF